MDKSPTSELIINLLQNNPTEQFTQNDLAKLLNKDKATISYHIKQLEKTNHIIVVKYGKYKLIRHKNLSITPQPHTIQLCNSNKTIQKSSKRIKLKNPSLTLNVRKTRKISLPQAIKENLNWKRGHTIIFFEKGNTIYFKVKAD